ncbi:hypothetical protein [Riemerella columbina]|uniref:hypothetical protein n=1 Tax=Riemerella columbina TaxID=103810 RepID=UPI00037E4C7D|nr:hypothetical protein [Riemerella columbina]
MKKTVLLLGVMAMSIVACNKKDGAATKTEGTEDTVVVVEGKGETVVATEGTADVPEFKDPEIQKFANEFAAYYKDLTEAVKSSDATKMGELQQKGTELAQKAQEQMTKMSPEDAKTWSEWSVKIAQDAQKAQQGQ